MIKTDFIETGDLQIPSSGWQEHQRIRLQRLKEQRQRMENMKQVVQQYSRIISDLQSKNRILEGENQQLKALIQRKDINLSQNENLVQKYEKIHAELQRERELRQNYEITIDSLKKQLINTQKQRQYSRINLTTKLRTQLQSDYQILQGLYDQLKSQMYFLQKQNITLRDTIRQQSKNYYDKDILYYGSRTNKNHSRGNCYQDISNFDDKTFKYTLSQKQSNIQKSNFVNLSQPITAKKSTIKNQSGYQNQIQKLLRQQIKKQDQLINKFKINQQKQLNLIQLLKKQKSKLCLCHKYGKSGKKYSNNKKQQVNIPTFKNYQNQ